MMASASDSNAGCCESRTGSMTLAEPGHNGTTQENVTHRRSRVNRLGKLNVPGREVHRPLLTPLASGQ
jgi:hypothetical protein